MRRTQAYFHAAPIPLRHVLFLCALLVGPVTACIGEDQRDWAGSEIPDGGGTTRDISDIETSLDTTGDPHSGIDPTADPGSGSDPTFDWPDTNPTDWVEGSWIIGETIEGRPLIVEQYGIEGPVLFLMAAIHGDERSAVTYSEQIRTDLQSGLARQTGSRVVFMQAANPDGIAMAKRYNANNIDLNRNFPADNFEPGSGGTEPLSEAESRAIRLAFDSSNATAAISVHCCAPILDYDGPAQSLAEAMAAAMDDEARFPVGRLGSRPGSFGSYVGVELDMPIITVEFALDEEMDIQTQLPSVERATEAALAWIVENGHDPELAGVAGLGLEESTLHFSVLAESAGGLPIRLEELVQGDGPPVLLLAGLVDNNHRALAVAEHIRRELLTDVNDVPLVLLTAANPDGIQNETVNNADGDDVADDFFAELFQTPEATALRTLVQDINPRLVVHVEYGSSDGVSTRGIAEDVMEDAIPDQLENLGTSDDPMAIWLGANDIALLNIEVNRDWSRGDNQHDDYFPNSDPVVYSTLTRRVIKPGVVCGEDGYCDRLCVVDPDCG